MDFFILWNLMLTSTGSSIWLQVYSISNIDHPEFYSLLLDYLLFLHFIFKAFLVISFSVILKLPFLPITLVLQIPNLKPISNSARTAKSFCLSNRINRRFCKISTCNAGRCLTCHHISCESTVTSSINGNKYGIKIDKDVD